MKIELLKQKIKKFPPRPGIYFFKNSQGEVIYIGKALSLKNRIKSYFLPNPDIKVQNILGETDDIDYLLVSSEKEASFLENNYIQFYQPKFNLRLKDDKSFPFLKITVKEKFPGIYLSRRVEDDGAKYFGPFSPAEEARKLITLIARSFGLRTCDNQVFKNRKRPCLEYDLKMCSAPCVGLVSENKYRDNLEEALLLLEGKKSHLLHQLREKMDQAAAELNFEEAARLRDIIRALESLKEIQRVISVGKENMDIVGYAHREGKAGIFIFHMREGRIRASSAKLVEKPASEDEAEILLRALEEKYQQDKPPANILLPFHLKKDEEEKLRNCFFQPHLNTQLLYPDNKKRKVILELANQNAWLLLEKDETAGPLAEIGKLLGLPSPPRRIEGVDISNTGGQESVGSLVVFVDGQPVKSDYRKYRIKTVHGPDDFASIREVLSRRLQRLLQENQPLPDLIFVDGGKGQLGVAREVLESFGLSRIPACSLAKKEEIIFSANHPEGLRLDPTSEALKLFQHLRNEAHRFAISFHRQRRQKASFASELDGIPGIGPVRKRKLLISYGSLET
ncbi:MAG: excinuclease ABC subunit UvrC, partial [Candidatus Saccharicenans sp.]